MKYRCGPTRAGVHSTVMLNASSARTAPLRGINLKCASSVRAEAAKDEEREPAPARAPAGPPPLLLLLQQRTGSNTTIDVLEVARTRIVNLCPSNGTQCVTSAIGHRINVAGTTPSPISSEIDDDGAIGDAKDVINSLLSECAISLRGGANDGTTADMSCVTTADPAFVVPDTVSANDAAVGIAVPIAAAAVFVAAEVKPPSGSPSMRTSVMSTGISRFASLSLVSYSKKVTVPLCASGIHSTVRVHVRPSTTLTDSPAFISGRAMPSRNRSESSSACCRRRVFGFAGVASSSLSESEVYSRNGCCCCCCSLLLPPPPPLLLLLLLVSSFVCGVALRSTSSPMRARFSASIWRIAASILSVLFLRR
ncbi:hypothetical protein DQ04_17241010 [Trypanosoma grayi]|uniref:hypothetical protein n=1 Tax=Trypanosoma grayi TaxID=71804 RepID=UPI0004F4B8D2|nr:hypothetical protein DQ04_17241010 [Trypanosoma grayi]KEG05928.1 hypothetical protein DQ04_17241010 [Trypanosoma grayi]